MNMRPLKNRVVIVRDTEERKTESGIVIPDHATEKPARGTVVRIGPEVRFITVGDIVMFGKYAGTEIKHEGKDYIVIDEDEAWGVLSG